MRSPLTLGLVSPRIYLPFNMGATVMEPVIAHEKLCLARRDHWWKLLGFLDCTGRNNCLCCHSSFPSDKSSAGGTW